MSNSKGFITFAFGAKKYIDMAVAMVKSARLHGSQSKFAVVCDQECSALKDNFDLLISVNDDYGNGVSQKLHIDCYSPFAKTIFVDSDCLFFNNADELWTLLESSEGFGVESYDYKTYGDHYYSISDVDYMLDHFKINGFPVFNTGLFYFDNSQNSKNVFLKARDIYEIHKELPFKEFKNSSVNDEPVYQLALELCSIRPLEWKSTMTLACYDEKYMRGIDVLRPHSGYFKEGIKVDPVLIHFNISTQDMFAYLREQKKVLYNGKKLRATFEAYLLSSFRKTLTFLKRYFVQVPLYFCWDLYRKIFPKREGSKLRKFELLIKGFFK